MWYKLEGKIPVLSDSSTAFRDNTDEERRVAHTIVGESRISTVFLCLDHQHGDGPPLLFETMVFGGPLTDEQERYSTWDEAEEGHKRKVKRVRAASRQSM